MYVIAGLALGDPNVTIGACITTKVKSEILEEDFGGKLIYLVTLHLARLCVYIHI